jgi:hypothetical protein
MPPLLLDEPPPEELLLEELLLEELLDELLLVPPLPDEPPHPTSASMDPSTQIPADRVANRDEFIMMSLIISRTRTLISPRMAAATGTCSTVVFVDC